MLASGLKVALRPIIHDLKRLNGGFELSNTNNLKETIIVKAILIAVVGDNKGLNEAAGCWPRILRESLVELVLQIIRRFKLLQESTASGSHWL